MYNFVMTYDDIRAKLVDLPFKPFRMHLSDGSRIDVVNVGMAVPGLNSVLLPYKLGKDPEGNQIVAYWRTVAYSHIVQFGDIDETIEHKRRKRK